MTITFLDIELANPNDPDHWETLRFLVDSGVLNSVAPRDVLERLGIRPLSTQQFRLANGDTIKRQRGGAAFRVRDRVGGANVLFGEAGDSNPIGATALSALGMGLDPIKRELIELPMVL